MAPAEHFVGRATELGSFDHLLAGLDRGGASAVELVGAPGIGKTRLLAELAARADGLGHLVLSGSASELERDLPYWVFVDALDDYVQGLEPHRLDALEADIRSELASVLPSLSRFAAARGVAFQHERYRSHRAVRELLERLTATRPLVLVLDDLHWADPASVDLLGALLRRPPEAAVLIALAVRPRQVPERLSAALERAHRSGILVGLELSTLTRGEAQELLGEAIDGTAATALYDESGGNPFYLEQLARTLTWAPDDGTALPDPSLAGLDVPPNVATALAEELALLSAVARLVLEGAAVAGDPFEPELAAAAASIPEAATLEALDELLRRDLIRQTDVPRRFRFRHPLVRRAVYESAPRGWRLGAHERCADALAALGATAADRAHHVHRSARRGDSAAIAILREAGEAAAQRAPASAATWFANALDLLPDAAPAEMRVELLLARSSALAATGHFPESHAALVDALSFVPEDSLALRVRLTAACAAAEHLLRHHDQAHARLARALDDLANLRSPEAVELMIELALDSRHRTEYEQMRQWSVRGLETARSLADKPLIAAAVALVSVADAFAGAISDAEAHRLEAATLVDEMSDSVLALRLDAISSLATAELYLDRYQEACTHSERAIAVARATGQVGRVPYLSPTLGSARVYRGQLREAAEVLNDGVEATRLSHDLQGLAWNLLNGSSAALAFGDLETALVTAQESVDLTSEFGRTLIAVRARAVWAAALLESGEPARAIDALVDSAGGEELPFLPGGWRSNRLELLTRCCLAVDRVGDGARAAAEAEACAAAYELPMATAMAHRAAAAVALHSNHPEIAAERALASAAAADEIAAPIEAAVSRTLAGRALARAGRTDSAAAELERAAAELHALGATRYRAEAEQELRKLGRRIHRRTRAGEADGVGVETLTERELQVARLVVDRKTNREIAEVLFLSPKTVETHLRNIFRKLGVANRVELARAVEHAERVELSGS